MNETLPDPDVTTFEKAELDIETAFTGTSIPSDVEAKTDVRPLRTPAALLEAEIMSCERTDLDTATAFTVAVSESDRGLKAAPRPVSVAQVLSALVEPSIATAPTDELNANTVFAGQPSFI